MLNYIYIKFLLCIFVGGTTWFFLPSQVSYVGAEFAVGYRMLFGGLSLLVFAFMTQKPFPKLNKRIVVWLCLNGCLLYSINYVLCYVAAQYISTGLISLIVSAMVIPNMILGRFVLKNPFTINGVLGALLCLTGLSLIFLKDSLINSDSLSGVGFILVFSSIFLSASGSVIGGKLITEGLNVYWATALAMTIGAILALAIALVIKGQFLWSNEVGFLLPLAYLSIPAATVFLVYMDVVHKLGAAKASYIWIFIPLISLNLSAAFEGMTWSVEKIVGSALVILGGLLALAKQKLSDPKIT